MKLLRFVRFGLGVALPISIVALLSIGGIGDPARGQSQTTAPKKQHAELFKYRTGKKLPELAARSKGEEDVQVEVHQSSGWGLPGTSLPSYPHPYLMVISSGADAVVIGVAKSAASGLTPDEGFIYTDWQFEVEEILKDNISSPLGIFSNITVTRPGGSLTLSGKKVLARHTNFLPFSPGARYLLFLRFLPATNAYEAFGDMSFELTQSKVHKLSRSSPLSWTDEPQTQEFLAEVRAAVSYKR